jgi:hypothetical protein
VPASSAVVADAGTAGNDVLEKERRYTSIGGTREVPDHDFSIQVSSAVSPTGRTKVLLVCVLLCVCIHLCVCMCLCRKRERERERENERKRERERVCVRGPLTVMYTYTHTDYAHALRVFRTRYGQ